MGGKSPVRFTIRTLMFVIICVIGLLVGFRVGHQRGYSAGLRQRISEQPVAEVYEVAELTFRSVEDSAVGGFQVVRIDFDTLIELICSTIEPDTWDVVGGAGTIRGVDANQSLVIWQQPYVHRQIQALFRELRDTQLADGAVGIDANRDDGSQ